MAIVFVDKWSNWSPRVNSGSGALELILFSYSSAPFDGSGLCQIDFFHKIIGTRIWKLARARKTFQIGIFSMVLLFEWED